MLFALLFGSAAAAVLAYFASRRFESEHHILRAACYTAVAALIPPLVYTLIEFKQLDAVYWWAVPLAALLALLFFLTRDSQLPWAVSYGVRGLRVWVFVLLASAAGYGAMLRYTQADWYFWTAVFFGVLVGASEIISRYRDEPGAALLSLPGLVYLSINGALSAAAYGLLRCYRESLFPAIKDDPLMTSIIAGFGAMVVMRSKIFSFKTASGEDFAVGPDAVITIFLRSVDRAIDRWRSINRQRLVFRTTQNIAFSSRIADFFKGNVAAYQNLSNEEKGELKNAIEDVSKQADLDPQLKLMAIAFGFLNISGEGNYTELMEDLRTFLNQPLPTPPAPTPASATPAPAIPAAPASTPPPPAPTSTAPAPTTPVSPASPP
ncbi:MAG TPA: hypothetical protein VK395_15395 [Gemmataceae bacterium]|nr:hypothetical protein [Gemmataceae bacterium]